MKEMSKSSLHMSRVASLCCVVCRNEKLAEDSPAEVHHIRDGYGRGQKAPYYETIPLCTIHHRSGAEGGHVGFHQSPARFIEKYGSERDLLAQTNIDLQ